jgi:serine/threonine protein kinase
MTLPAAPEPLVPPRAVPGRQSGDQPIPGYRLLGLIGRGGAGEVWKCEAPGGLLKAIKFVSGVCDAPGGGPRADRDEVIRRVRSIRHPFLLSTERVEFVGDDLAIITELADRDLKTLWGECRRAGQAGIPRDRLLNYLREAAETLDLVNTQHDLRHLDIKPSNLFLVCNHVKIGDFGLAVLRSGRGAAPAATPYTAPEVLAGGSARQSDQYSLAVLYQEMLTGVLPFRGATPEELRQAHLRGQPDLEPLPGTDRSVVARALAGDPDLRFATCTELIKALVLGHVEMAVAPSGIRPAVPRPATAARPVARPVSTGRADPGRFREAADRPPPAVLSVPATPPAPGDGPPDPAEDDGELPVYQFVRCLNRTPLTEVWDVHDSRGRRRLAKILFGRAGADAAALNRLLALRHPVLAPLEFVQHTPGRLVLASEPIKKSLRDCLQECRSNGLPGVPRDRLLGWLREAAEALTELARREGLQHLGLNPRNLFLTGERVRVADFGVAQLLWLPTGEAVSRMNPRYSAPELVQGKLSPACDQYSLAVIYHELLTGQLPQGAGTGRPVSPADLQGLPGEERVALARALDPVPEHRWETCADLFDALGPSAVPRGVPAEVSRSAAHPVVTASATPDSPAEPEPDETASHVAEAESEREKPEREPDAPASDVTVPLPSRGVTGGKSIADLPAAPAEAEGPGRDADGRPEEAAAPASPLRSFVSGLFRRPDPGAAERPPAAEPLAEEPPTALEPEPEPPPEEAHAAPQPPADAAHTILESRFGVNLSAVTVRHRLDGVRRQWNGREVHGDHENLAFLMKPPRSFWQRFATQPVALEVHIQLKEAPAPGEATTEVAVAILPPRDARELDDPVARTLGQMLLECIRTSLAVQAKGRDQERLPWPHPLKLWPVHAGGRLGEPVECQGKDLSLNGIGFYVPGEPPPKVVRLQLPRTDQNPAMTVPARVVRVHSFGDGWHEVGAILLMR